MNTPDLLVLTEHDVAACLDGRLTDLITIIRDAYHSYYRGDILSPESVFLKFDPDKPERAIGLAASTPDLFGIKWIASFPGNVVAGANRASAVIVVNSPTSGYPCALIEGSLISALRTAASAVAAADALHTSGDFAAIGVIGTGRISFEFVRVLTALRADVAGVVVYDRSADNVDRFAKAMVNACPSIPVTHESTVDDVLRKAPLVCIATSATAPHIESLAAMPADGTVIHLSLRDLAPAAIANAEHVVDDARWAFSHGTSLALTAQQHGRHTVHTHTLQEVFDGDYTRSAVKRLVFSPFGLGALDIALTAHVVALAGELGLGATLPPLSSGPWYA
jgi:2,3-diaminopropionate biosynthesis protein SbnB